MTELAQRRAAEAALAEFYVEVKEGRAISGKQITFAEFASLWMKEHVEANLAPKTAFEYGKQLIAVNNTFGHVKLQQVSPLHIQKLYKKLAATGLSSNSVHAYHRLLSALFGKALKWGYLSISPMTRVEAPKKVKMAMPSFDMEATQNLLVALEGKPIKFRAFILLDIFTGLRSSELVGLKWNDIDFDQHELTIQRIVQFISGKGIIIKNPKRDSMRALSFPPQVGAALMELKAAQEQESQIEGWIDSGFVFTQMNGSPMFPTSPSQWFNKFLKRHGLPHMRLHDLRHMHASFLIAQGVDPVTVSKRLGHTTTSTTLNLYAHALKDKDKEASNRLAASLLPE